MSLPTHSKTAYIADDDPEDIQLLCEVIREIDATIHTRTFTNGKDVLTQLLASAERDLPQILLLDYAMPQLTGSEVLKQLANHSRYSRISKFVLSTSSAAQYMEECLRNGADAYFVKPNSMAELRSIANKIFRDEVW